jgi:hypothetical protein
VRILPTCSRPVGEGAKRVMLMGRALSQIGVRAKAYDTSRCNPSPDRPLSSTSGA